jgi:hypothetical protein
VKSSVPKPDGFISLLLTEMCSEKNYWALVVDILYVQLLYTQIFFRTRFIRYTVLKFTYPWQHIYGTRWWSYVQKTNIEHSQLVYYHSTVEDLIIFPNTFHIWYSSFTEPLRHIYGTQDYWNTTCTVYEIADIRKKITNQNFVVSYRHR